MLGHRDASTKTTRSISQAHFDQLFDVPTFHRCFICLPHKHPNSWKYSDLIFSRKFTCQGKCHNQHRFCHPGKTLNEIFFVCVEDFDKQCENINILFVSCLKQGICDNHTRDKKKKMLEEFDQH